MNSPRTTFELDWDSKIEVLEAVKALFKNSVHKVETRYERTTTPGLLVQYRGDWSAPYAYCSWDWQGLKVYGIPTKERRHPNEILIDLSDPNFIYTIYHLMCNRLIAMARARLEGWDV